MSDLVTASWDWGSFWENFMASGGGVLLALYVVQIAFALIGAISSIVGLIRGITNKQTTAIALGGIGIGCMILGLFFFGIVLWTAGMICGLMACKRSKQPRMLSYEEFKQRKAMMQDPEYAEYMRTMHGIEDTGGMTAEQKFDRRVAANPLIGLSEAEFSRLNLKAKHGTLSPAEQQMYNDYIQASMKKNGGEVKPPMSDGKLGAIVLVVIVIGLVLWFGFNSASQNGMFDHLSNAPMSETVSEYVTEISVWSTDETGNPSMTTKYTAVDQNGHIIDEHDVYDTPEEVPEPEWHESSNGKQTIEDLGNGTILMYGDMPIFK